jgi:ribosomal protein S27E
VAEIELTCPACGHSTTTTQRPGKATKCHRCHDEFRVPLKLSGREGQREVTCPHCEDEQHTNAAPGRKTKCKACGEAFRVPMRKSESGREVTCSSCGEAFTTSALPGKKVRCTACGETTRVPLRDASETTHDPNAALRPSPCANCGEPYPQSWAGCPECGMARGAEALRQAGGRLAIAAALYVALLLLFFTLSFVVYDGRPPQWLRLAAGLTVAMVLVYEGTYARR